MFFYLFLLFTIIPLVELWLLIQIGQTTSTLFAISLVIVTGIIGAALARQQGLQNWRKLQQGLAGGNPPTDALLDGFLILLAGAVLITPGIITDLFGFALLIPPIRSIIKKWLKEAAKKRTVVHFQSMSGFSEEGFQTRHPDHRSEENEQVIDVDFTSETIED